MSYSVIITSFNQRELVFIQRSPIRALLSAIGFRQNMPLTVVFGPSAHGIYYQKTSALMLHSRLGQMMWTAIQ
jgi:hypothetical protein